MRSKIRLCYRKIIDVNSLKAWDRAVFDATHLEFYMQAQRLDPEGKWKSFQELADNTASADQLQYLTSSAAIGYIRHLKDVIPDIENASGKRCLPFKDFKFEILQSHIEDKTQHRIAIWFYSVPLTWIDSVGDQLLISYDSEGLRSEAFVETDLVKLVPFLSISHFKHSAFNP